MVQNLLHQILRSRPIDDEIKQRSTSRRSKNPHTEFTLHQRIHTVRWYGERDQDEQQRLTPEIHLEDGPLQSDEVPVC